MPLSLGIASAAGSLKNNAEPLALGYRVNWVTNPSFEIDTTNWFSIASATLSRVTTESRDGSASLQVVNASASAVQFGTTAGPMIPLIAGQGEYTISAYVKLAAEATTANYFLRYLQYTNIGGVQVGAANIGIQSLSVTGNWVRLTGTFTKAETANYLIIRVVTNSTTNGDTFFVDSVMVEKGSSAGTYFDGSTNGFWAGEPHASISGASPY